MIETRSNETKDITNSRNFWRGHHLTDLVRLVALGDIAYCQKFAHAERMFLEEELKSNEIGDREHASDSIGIDGEKADAFERYYRESLEYFFNATNDEPFYIVVGEPDKGICSGCAIGDHCSRRYQDNERRVDVVDVDQSFVDRFILLGKLLGLKGHITEIEREVSFADSPSKKVISLETTTGIARQIFKASLRPTLDISFMYTGQ